MTFSAALICKLVRERVPGLKGERWSQPFKDMGYFTCDQGGKMSTTRVDMSTPPVVGMFAVQWTEQVIADRVVRELKP